jgi:antitoxin CptB
VPAIAFGDLERRRLRWRARRGLLENDLLLTRFFERHGGSLVADDALALEALLDLPDGELLELLLGRKEPGPPLDNNAVRCLLQRLRSS